MSISMMHRAGRHWSIIVLCVLLWSIGGLCASEAFSKTLYSYNDESGTRVITDNYNNIPPLYRSRVTTVEQEGDHFDGFLTGRGSGSGRVATIFSSGKGFVIDVPGMSFQQSKVITYAGAIALLCIVAMNLSRSEGIRVLALWCLLMTAICAPVLLYIADDGAGTIMKNKAADIRQKQHDRLSQTQ
jgi:hypothetical protein